MAVLSEVIDGTTPITETHPEEKRAAIGTTWDSASDLTLKQVSDGLQAEHSSAGAHNANVIDQDEINLSSAANATGEAVRYQEFSAQHVWNTGAHRTDVEVITAQAQVNLGDAAAASGDAVRYNEFTQEHAAGGGHSADIIDQAEMNLSSAANASGEAVRYNEFISEHSQAGAHSIDQAQMALTAASSATGEAVRHDEFSAEHTASTGAHRTDVAFITSQGQVNLGSAAAASGDAVRYNEYNTHQHTEFLLIYSDCQISSADETDAAVMHVYNRNDSATTVMTAIRACVYKRAGLDGLRLTGRKTNGSTSDSDAYIRLYCASLQAEEQVLYTDNGTPFDLTLDISSLSDDATYEIDVQLRWNVAHTNGYDVSLDRAQVWGETTVATPE